MKKNKYCCYEIQRKLEGQFNEESLRRERVWIE
jgi:hypothetical protein